MSESSSSSSSSLASKVATAAGVIAFGMIVYNLLRRSIQPRVASLRPTKNNDIVVVVTGASTGIGRAMAVALAGRGYRVYAGVRKDDDARSIRAEATAAGCEQQLEPIIIDVTSDDSVEAALAVMEAHHRRLQQQQQQQQQQPLAVHCLINNAGVIYSSPAEFHRMDEFEKVLQVNVVGAVRVTRAVLPLLRRAGRGRARIVNVGSLNGLVATPFRTAYCASKFALEGFNDSLRRELRPWAIHVAMINPGYIRTAIFGKNLAGAQTLRQEMPAAARQLYGPFYSEDNVQETLQTISGAAGEPVVVVDAVVHVLVSEYPEYSYAVGPMAMQAVLSKCVFPAWLVDFFMSKQMWPRHFPIAETVTEKE